MEKFSKGYLLCLTLLLCSVAAAPGSTVTDFDDDQATRSFLDFAYNRLLEGSPLEYKDIIESPFGIGYILANADTKVWNMPTDGVNKVLKTSSKESASQQYAKRMEKLKLGKIKTANFLFASNKTSPVTLPDSSKMLETQLIYTDFMDNWENSWKLMNDHMSTETGGKLKNKLIPNVLGGAIHDFTVGAYLNTNYYKINWKDKWSSVGDRNISEGVSIPFLQTEGKYPMLKTEDFTTVAIPTENSDNFMVFVLPKDSDFKNLEKLVNLYPSNLPVSTDIKKILIPSLKLTTFKQHLSELTKLGLENTFCPPGEPRKQGEKISGGKLQYIATRPFFGGPIVQAGHLEIAQEFIEVASGTGMTINSLEKWVKVTNAKFSESEKSPNGTTGPAATTTRPAAAPKTIQKAATTTTKKPATKTTKRSETTTTKKPVAAADTNSIIFDKPFFWFLHNKQLGPLYYGAVISMDQKEVKLTREETLIQQLFDAAKMTGAWNCP